MAKEPGFIISDIHEVAYWFRIPKGTRLTDDVSLHFSVENAFSIHTEIKTIEVLLKIIIHKDSTDFTSKRPPLLDYQVGFRFEISDLDTTMHPDEEPGYEYVQLPKGLAVALVATAYSTCRGMLFIRTAGSALQDYLLPVANPVSLTNDVKDRIQRKIVEVASPEATQKQTAT